MWRSPQYDACLFFNGFHVCTCQTHILAPTGIIHAMHWTWLLHPQRKRIRIRIMFSLAQCIKHGPMVYVETFCCNHALKLLELKIHSLATLLSTQAIQARCTADRLARNLELVG